MTSFSNLSISNAIRGTDTVKKITLGYNLVWPKVPIFTFDTYQSGGELDFEVTSDTGIIATVINGNECRLHPVSQTNINTVRAENTGYSRTYNVPSGTDLTRVNIPLFQRREVSVTGRGTRSSRYVTDHYVGTATVRITNDFSSSVTFSATLGGTTITRTIAGRSFTEINFTGLGGGSKTIAITNVSDNTTENITINLNYTQQRITPIYYRFGAIANEQTISSNLTKVDVYALTEAEANASSSLFVSQSRSARISIKDFSLQFGGGGCFFYFGYSGYLNLDDRGIGYEPNATIDGTGMTGIPDRYFYMFFLQFKTDHNGSVVQYRVSLPVWNSNLTETNRNWQPWTTGTRINFSTFYGVPNFSYVGRRFWPEARVEFVNSLIPASGLVLYDVPVPPAATSVPADSLFFDNADTLGNISTVSMKDIAVNSIKVQSQNNLLAVQTDSTGLYDDLKSNKPAMLQSSANPSFNTLHGNGTSYSYS